MKNREKDPQASKKEHDAGERIQPYTFVQRAFFVLGMVLLFGFLIVFLGQAVQVLMLLFLGILFAIVLDAFRNLLVRNTFITPGWGLILVLLLLIGLVVGAGFLVAPTISQQARDLSEVLPESFEQFVGELEQYWWGRRLSEALQGDNMVPEDTNVLGSIAEFFSTAFGAIANVAIVLVVGIYLAANPSLYINGIIGLLPHTRRERAGEVLKTLGHTLRWWLIGQGVSMTVLGIMSGIGLWLLGIPFAPILALITAIFTFIPYLGPLLSMVFPILLALMEGPTAALYVFIFYIFLQNFEGYVVTPNVQERAVLLPPALLITVEVMMAVTAGFLGLVIATPLLAVLLVLVKLLYVEDVLGDEVKLR